MFLDVIEALIFDMDGVLIDSMNQHAVAWKIAFIEQGISIDEKDIFALEGENDTGIVKNILSMSKDHCCKLEHLFTTIPARKHELFDQDRVTMFKDIDLYLKSFKSKFKLAVVSGSDRIIVETIINKYFPQIFDAIVSGDDTTNGKPSPDPYDKAVEILGTEKQNCIVIENAILGVLSATNAGIFTVGIPTYLNRKELEHADIVLKDHSELFRFLDLLMRT